MRRMIAFAAAAALVPAVALAHHGWSSYDPNNALTLEGPIKSVKYQNPHGEIELAHDGKDWLVVLAPPSRMERRGLPREMLEVGKRVTVVGYPSRHDPREMRAERISVGESTIELR
ncbi:MAG: DUF6152 family protein [Rhodospirillales bacterium]